MNSIDFREFAGGALQEKLNIAFDKVIQNMLDVNTPYKDKRKIVCTITFQQDESRSETEVDVGVETKVPSVCKTVTRMGIGRNLKTGEIFVEEYGKGVKGQMAMTFNENEVDAETGEIKEQPDNVVPVRKAGNE